MSRNESLESRIRTAALVGVDAAMYAAVTLVLTVSFALVAAVATGGELVRAKVFLFLIGFGLLGYSTIRLWPSSPSDLEDDGQSGVSIDETGRSIPSTNDQTTFQAFVRAMPPLRWLRPPPPQRRITPAGKLFLGSLAILATSYLMESVFGVV